MVFHINSVHELCVKITCTPLIIFLHFGSKSYFWDVYSLDVYCVPSVLFNSCFVAGILPRKISIKMHCDAIMHCAYNVHHGWSCAYIIHAFKCSLCVIRSMKLDLFQIKIVCCVCSDLHVGLHVFMEAIQSYEFHTFMYFLQLHMYNLCTVYSTGSPSAC